MEQTAEKKIIPTVERWSSMRAIVKPRQKAARKDESVCKNCKEFSNKPGYCKLKKEFSARKGTCEDFGVKK